MGRMVTKRMKWTSPIQSALNNIRSYSHLVEGYGRLYKNAVASGDKKNASDFANLLIWHSKQAALAGNLILNEGKPVRMAIEEIEREMAARRQEAA